MMARLANSTEHVSHEFYDRRIDQLCKQLKTAGDQMCAMERRIAVQMQERDEKIRRLERQSTSFSTWGPNPPKRFCPQEFRGPAGHDQQVPNLCRGSDAEVSGYTLKARPADLPPGPA